jgi:hypothetical protein
MQALKTGANLAKVGETLSPEERELITKYPTVAKLVGYGIDSIKSRLGAATAGAAKDAAVGGGVTYLNTGGDKTKALEDGALAGGVSGIAGGATGVAEALAQKGKDAADTVRQMAEMAKDAPSRMELEDNLRNLVEHGSAEEKEAAQAELDKSAKDIDSMGNGAPSHTQLAQSAQQMVNDADSARHAGYRAAGKHLKTMTAGTTVPLTRFPLRGQGRPASTPCWTRWRV